jgi:hypothetical protein
MLTATAGPDPTQSDTIVRAENSRRRRRRGDKCPPGYFHDASFERTPGISGTLV